MKDSKSSIKGEPYAFEVALVGVVRPSGSINDAAPGLSIQLDPDWC